MDGKPAAALLKSFTCPSCGGTVTLRTMGQAVSASCTYCRAIIDVNNSEYALIEAANKKLAIEPVIPLGQRGSLDGELFEVVGFMQRGVSDAGFTWHEYLLFNPYKGFRWLVLAEGHWSYVKTIKDLPAQTSKDAAYAGRSYRLFSRDDAKVLYVIGEFYWRVRFGDVTKVEDYICPPYILSSEQDPTEVNWSHGTYLEPEQIKAAFKLTKLLPRKVGIGANEPAPPAAPKLKKQWLYTLLVLVVIQLLFKATAENKVVWAESFTLDLQTPGSTRTPPAATQVSPQFTLSGWPKNGSIEVTSDVNNGWFELEGALINDTSEVALPFAAGVEYYHGVDGGEQWSEGSTSTAEVVHDLPGGTYHLSFDAVGSQTALSGAAAPDARWGLPYRVAVRRGIVSWENFWWAMVLVSIFPLSQWLRSNRFEDARWAKSDFTP